MKKPSVKVPKELLWDYNKAPDDLIWKLQRLADFFPRYGRDKNTVQELNKNIRKLKIDAGTKNLIKFYYEKLKK